MARLIYALNQSLDGFVDHEAFVPKPDMFQHFIEDMRGLAGLIHGRRMYEAMRYWDQAQPDWGPPEQAYAAAWSSKPKWVVSRSLPAVGPNATLVRDDVPAALRRLKAEIDGDVEVAGPELAATLSDLGLIDEYRIYLHPDVLGAGRPYFHRPPPRLRLTESLRVGADVVRLTYVPA